MKKILLIIALLFVKSAIIYGQDIRNISPVVLPVSGTYTVISGQTVNIISARSIVLQPGTTFSAGSNVYIGTNKSLIAPAPSNANEDILRNWTLFRSYDEDGNEVGAEKTFYDNNGKELQSQLKSESMKHVLASQPLYDLQGKAIGKTLMAPINNSEFSYKDNFITNTSGTNYDYKNFDGDQTYGLHSKTNNPDPVGSSSIGTLGWYYSDNNSLEPMVPTTAYPYSRTDNYRDGTTATRSSSGVGETLKLGAGHETSGNNFPVINELNVYSEIRNKFNATQPIGLLPVTFASNALQTIGQDENGTQGLTITDLSGNILMTARAEPVATSAWLTVTNTFTLNQPSNLFKARVKFGAISSWALEDNIVGLTVLSSNNVKIYKNSVLLAAGTYNIAPASANDNAVYDIESYQPFYYYYTKTNSLAGVQSDNSSVGNFPALKEEPATSTIQYFYLTSPSPVTVTGLCSIYEMKTETKLFSFTSGQILPAGYYKAVTTNDPNNPTTVPATVTYSNGYSDIRYSFYDQTGQLFADIAPNGVKAYLTNSSLYTNAFNIPYTNKYEYDLQSRMIANTTTDGGRTEFIYRTDGRIRFSQNAVQRIASGGNERFSYTNYDDKGRPVESGEYITPVGGSFTFSSAKTNYSLIETTVTGGGLTGGTKQDQINTYYDLPATNLTLSGYIQDEGFLKGAVSYTQNTASSTWYNYDSQGRVVWMVKKITDMPVNTYKTVDYTYNAQGDLIKIDFQKSNPTEHFIHYYDYDADRRLVNVQTSRNDVTKLQQASYSYYLHGPIKRIELADDLQGIDYAYTSQGWLKAINSPTAIPSKDASKDGDAGSLFAPDAFGMQMEYFPGDYSRTGSNIINIPTGQNTYFNGNVNGISWQNKPSTAASATPSMYTYEYNNKYQFTRAIWGTPSYSSTPSFTPDATGGGKFKEHGITYDPNGNIKSLLRTNSSGVAGDNFENYQYQQGTNKLASVGTNSSPGSYGTYTYDELGRIKSQAQTSGTNYFKYDVSGKITGIYTNPGFSGVPVVSYAYDESGNRIKSVNSTTSTYYIYDPSGNVLAIYTGTNGSTISDIPVYGAERIGIYSVAGNNYLYELRDNVGSVRAVINRTKVSGQPDIFAFNDYYPFGTKARWLTSSYRYEYQGLFAEKDGATGYANFDLRMYDTRIGRWLSFDPQAQYASPYLGMGNNPVTHSDPTGGEDEDDWDWYRDDETGATFWKEGSAATVTQGGIEYRNIGATFDQEYEGFVQHYEQNVVTDITEIGAKDVKKGQKIPANFYSNGHIINVTFGVTTSDNISSDRFIRKQLLSGFFKTVDMLDKTSRINSLHISATTNGAHSSSSNHYVTNLRGAMDISGINGTRVINMSADQVCDIQTKIQANIHNIRENYGPQAMYKQNVDYIESTSEAWKDLTKIHKNHLHWAFNF